MLQDGAIVAQGHFDQLMQNNSEFANQINSVLSQHEQEMMSPEAQAQGKKREAGGKKGKSGANGKGKYIS